MSARFEPQEGSWEHIKRAVTPIDELAVSDVCPKCGKHFRYALSRQRLCYWCHYGIDEHKKPEPRKPNPLRKKVKTR